MATNAPIIQRIYLLSSVADSLLQSIPGPELNKYYHFIYLRLTYDYHASHQTKELGPGLCPLDLRSACQQGPLFVALSCQQQKHLNTAPKPPHR